MCKRWRIHFFGALVVPTCDNKLAELSLRLYHRAIRVFVKVALKNNTTFKKKEIVLSSGVKVAAVAATLTQDPGQGGGPAAPGTASTVPAPAAATSPRAWAWEKRDGSVAIARRLQTKPL